MYLRQNYYTLTIRFAKLDNQLDNRTMISTLRKSYTRQDICNIIKEKIEDNDDDDNLNTISFTIFIRNHYDHNLVKSIVNTKYMDIETFKNNLTIESISIDDILYKLEY